MGKKNNITFDINFVGHAEKLTNSIKTIQDKINKMKFNPNIEKSFNESFDGIYKALDKVKNRASKGMITSKDGEELQKLYHTFEQQWMKLSNKLGRMNINPEKFFPKEIKDRISAAEDALKKYKTALNNLEKYDGTKDENGESKITKQKKVIAATDKEIEEAGKQKSRRSEETIKKDLATEKRKLSGVEEGSAEANQINKRVKALQEELVLTKRLRSEGVKTEAEVAKQISQLETKRKNQEDLLADIEAETKRRQDQVAITKKAYETAAQASEKAISDFSSQASDASSTTFETQTEVTSGKKIIDEETTALKNQESQAQATAEAMDRLKRAFSFGSVVTMLTRSLREAVQVIKDLDAAMTETAVVTSYTVSDMWDQLDTYTKNANALGATTQGAYETMTLFYQQGLNSTQAWDLGIETMKMARIAGMDYAEATDMMTAALRGFNMELNDTSAQHINDVYSELAAITASDTYEISEAMTRTASIAANAGMDFDTASVYLAEAIETTREAPENIGTALKSIVARFASLTKDPSELSSDLQDALGGETVDANRVEAALKSAGVQARDTTGQFRDLSEVFLELNEKWDSLDLMTQRYVATQAAGTRQQSRFIAMMQNYDRTMELMNAAKNSTGAGEAQFDKTLDSLEAKLNKLSNAWNEFTMNILNSDILKGAVDAGTTILNIINKIIEALGSLTGPLAGISKSILSIGAIGGVISLGRNILNGGQLRENINTTSGESAKFAAKTRKGENIVGVSGAPRPDYFGKTKIEKNSIGNQELKNKANITLFEKNWKDSLKNSGGKITEDTAKIFDNLPAAVRKHLNKSNLGESIALSIAQDKYKKGEIDKKSIRQQAKVLWANASGGKTDTPEAIKKLIAENVKEGSIKFEGGTISKAFNDFSNRAHETSNSIYDISQALAAAGFKNTAAGLEVLSTAIQGLGGVATVAAKAITTLRGMMVDPKKSLGRMIGIPNKDDWKGKRDTALKDILNQNDITNIKKSSRKKKTKTTEDIRNFGKNGKLTTTLTAMSNESTGLFKILTKVLSVITAIPGPVLAIGAAFATVVGAFKFWKNNYSPEALYEKASKTAEQAAANTDRLKSSVDNLKSSLENLATMKEELDGLVAGTTEWTSKLLEANQAVLDIVHNFPELMQYVSADDTGLLTLDSEGVQEYQNALNETLASAQAVQQIADGRKSGTYLVKEAQEELKAARVNRLKAILLNKDTKEKLKQDTEIAKDSKYLAKDQSETIQASASKQAISTLLKNSEINGVTNDYVDSISAILSKSFNDIDTSGLYNKDTMLQYAEDNQLTFAEKNRKNVTFKDAENNEITYTREEFKNLASINETLQKATENAQDLENALFAADKATATWNDNIKINGEQLSALDRKNVFSKVMAQDASVNEDMIDALVNSELGLNNLLDYVISNLGDDAESQKQALSNILGEEVTNIKAATKKLKEQFKQNAVEIDKAQQQNDKTLATLLAKAEQRTNGKVYKTLDKVNTKVIRKNIARELKKYTSAQKTMLATIGSQLENIGGIESFDIFNDAFRKAFQEGFTSNGKNEMLSQDQKDELSGWLEGVNWENPIEAATALRTALDSDSEAIRKTAKNLQGLGDTAYTSANQLKYFVSSNEYSELTEDLQELLDANGSITGDNIRELSKESKTLKNLLDEDTISATGLGRVLTSFQKGTLAIDDMTDGLTALIGGMDTLQDLASDTVDEISNFDPGLDEGEGADKYKEWVEASQEFYKNAEYGNTQFQNYLKEIFGTETWDKLYTKYDGDLQKVEESLMGRISQFGTGDMYEAWEKLLTGSEAKKFEKLGLELSKNASGGFKLTDVNSKDLTKSTEELVQALMKAKDISEVTAREMITDWKNYSPDMSVVLNANDLKANIKNIKEEITKTFGSDGNEFEVQLMTSQDIENAQKILDDANISAAEQLQYWEDVADELGVSEKKIEKITDNSRFEGLTNKQYKKEVRKAIEEIQSEINNSPLILDLEVDDEGLLEDVDNVIEQLDNLEGAEGDFFDKMSENGQIQLSDLVTQLQDAGLSLAQIYQIADAKSGEYEFINLDGEKVKLKNLEEEINSLPDALADEEQYKPMADAIVKALSNLTIDFKTGQISYVGEGTFYEDSEETKGITELTNVIKDVSSKINIVTIALGGLAASIGAIAVKGKIGGGLQKNAERFSTKSNTKKKIGNTALGKVGKFFTKANIKDNEGKTVIKVGSKDNIKKVENGKDHVGKSSNSKKPNTNTDPEIKASEELNSGNGNNGTKGESSVKQPKSGKLKTKLLNFANKEGLLSKILGKKSFEALSTKGKFALKGAGIAGTAITVGQGVKDYATAKDQKGKFQAVGDVTGTLATSAGMAKLGAAIGTGIAGPVGTAIGGLAGGTFGAVVGSKAGRAIGGLASSGADYIFGNEETGQKNIIERAIENKQNKKETKSETTANIKGNAVKGENTSKLKLYTEAAKDLKKIETVEAEVTANVYGSVLDTSRKDILKVRTFIESAQGIEKLKDKNDKNVNVNVDGNVLDTKKGKLKRLAEFTESATQIDTLSKATYNKTINANIHGNVVEDTEDSKLITSKGLKNIKTFIENAQGIGEVEGEYKSSIKANLEGNVVQATENPILKSGYENLKTYIESAQGIKDLNGAYKSSITADLSGSIFDSDEKGYDIARLGAFVENAQGIKDLTTEDGSALTVDIIANAGGSVFNYEDPKKFANLGALIKNAEGIDTVQNKAEEPHRLDIIANFEGNLPSEEQSNNLGALITNAQGIDALPDSISKTLTINAYGNLFRTTGTSKTTGVNSDALNNFSAFANAYTLANNLPTGDENGIVSRSLTVNLKGTLFDRKLNEIDLLSSSAQGLTAIAGVPDLKRNFEINLGGTVFDADSDQVRNLSTISTSLNNLSTTSESISKSVNVSVNTGGVKDKTTTIKESFSSLSEIEDVKKTVDIQVTGDNVAVPATQLANIVKIGNDQLIKTIDITDKATDKITKVKSLWNNWQPKTKPLYVNVKKTGTNGITIGNKDKKINFDISTYAKGHNLASAAIGKNLGSAAKGAARGKLGPNGTGGETLTGELGQELVWEPNKGSAYLVGTQGPEVVDLPDNAVVWPADQTEKILKGEQHPSILQSNAKGKNFGSAGNGGTLSYTEGDPDGTNKNDSGNGDKKEPTYKKWFDKIFEPWYNNAKRFDKYMDKAEKAQKKYETISSDIHKSWKSINNSFNSIINNYRKARKQASTASSKISTKINSKLKNAYLRNSDGQLLKKGGKGLTNEKSEAIKVSKYFTVKDYIDADGHKRKSLELTTAGKKAKDTGGPRAEAIKNWESKLSGYVDEYNSYKDQIDEINDNIKEIKKQRVEKAADGIEQVAEMLKYDTEQKIKENQKQIDKLSEINDTIVDTNQDIIDAVNKSISKMRQARENEKTEKDLSNKRQQLAWLKADSSGANALQIKQLEEELADAETSYTDSLVDQKIDAMQTALDEAATQREKQITLLEKQNKLQEELLEDNKYWNEKAITWLNSNSEKTIEKAIKNYAFAKAEGNYLAADSTMKEINEGVSSYQDVSSSIGYDALKDIANRSGADSVLDEDGSVLSGSSSSQGRSFVKKQYQSQVYETKEGNVKFESGDKSDSKGRFTGTTTSGHTVRASATIGKNGEQNYTNFTYSNGYTKMVGKDSKGNLRIYTIDSKTGKETSSGIVTYDGYLKKTTADNLTAKRMEILMEIGAKRKKNKKSKFDVLEDLKTVQNIKWKKILEVAAKKGSTDSAKEVKKLAKNAGYKPDDEFLKAFRDTYITKYARKIYKTENGKQIYKYGSEETGATKAQNKRYYENVGTKNFSSKKFKTGGLADYTGPAWLDGTPSKPELVLNQQDTANFIQLKDTLASLLNGNNTSGNSVSSADTFNVTVNVQEIANDYDVDKVIDKVKKEITKSAAYRNNNTLSKVR